MTYEIATIIAPVFLCTALGYLWVRLERPFNSDMATTLIANVGTPCLVLSVLPNAKVSAEALGRVGLVTAASYPVLIALAVVVLRSAGLSLRTYLPSAVFPNTGNMGVPLCLFAFGQEGLALAIVFMTITTVLHFTVGMTIASGEFSPKRLARTTVLYAVALAVLLLYKGWHLPRWTQNTVDLLAGLTFPLMLLALGASLARLHLKNLGRSFFVSFLRLGLGLSVGLALATSFSLTGVDRGVVILECTMPAAVFNYLFAEYYGREPAEVASVVLLSTLISFATLPLLLAYLLG